MTISYIAIFIITSDYEIIPSGNTLEKKFVDQTRKFVSV